MSQIITNGVTLFYAQPTFGAKFTLDGFLKLNQGALLTLNKLITNDREIDKFNDQWGYLKIEQKLGGFTSRISIISEKEKDKTGLGGTPNHITYIPILKIEDSVIYNNGFNSSIFLTEALDSIILIKESGLLKVKSKEGVFDVTSTSNVYGRTIDSEIEEGSQVVFKMFPFSVIKTPNFPDNITFLPIAIINVDQEKITIL